MISPTDVKGMPRENQEKPALCALCTKSHARLPCCMAFTAPPILLAPCSAKPCPPSNLQVGGWVYMMSKHQRCDKHTWQDSGNRSGIYGRRLAEGWHAAAAAAQVSCRYITHGAKAAKPHIPRGHVQAELDGLKLGQPNGSLTVMGWILKCAEMIEKTKHFRSCLWQAMQQGRWCLRRSTAAARTLMQKACGQSNSKHCYYPMLCR